MTARLLVALRVRATPERAFHAFVHEIADWWVADPLFDFTVGRRGRLAFEPGEGGRLTETYDDGSVFEVGRITWWHPPQGLALTWRQASFGPELETEVRVTFESVGEAETRVSVEHTGWDRVPREHTARHGFPLGAFQSRHAEWWQKMLGKLRDRV